MHALLRFAAVAALAFAATTAVAADDQQNGNTKASGAQPAASATQQGTATPARDWRFVRHQNRWWYYTPANNWVVWHNNAWAPYRAGMFAGEQRLTSQPVRRYSYDPVQGNAGYYPRVFRSPGAYGSNRSIRYAGSKVNADYAPYTGGSMQ